VAVTAASLAWKLHEIDENVLEAVSFASARLPSGEPSIGEAYRDFLEFVSDKEAMFEVAGFRSRYIGYVGEQVAADELAAQGHLVEFATTSNNPGWDLLVDGAAVNVKTYGHIAGVNAHAAADPEVEFLVPTDIAGTSTLPNVSKLEGFGGEQVGDMWDGSVDAAQALVDGSFAVDAMSGGFPLTLIALTTYREARAVYEGKRLEHAARDLGMVVVCRGGGAIVGAKAGAAAGAWVDTAAGGTTLGVPTVVGAMGGGVVGSTLGASAMNWVKNMPLRHANNQLRDCLAAFGADFLQPEALQRLKRAIDAPLVRAEKAQATLEDACIFDRRSMRWILWPTREQVLRNAAFAQSELQIAALRARRDEVLVQFEAMLERPDAATYIGAAMVNAPALAASVGSGDPERRASVAEVRERAASIRSGLAASAR
jgi:hypothetical protein